MNQSTRSLVVFSALLAAAAVVLLANGLTTLNFDYGGHSVPAAPHEGPAQDEPSQPSGILGVAARVFFAVALALLPFAVFLYLFVPGARRPLFRDIVALLIVLLPLSILWRAPRGTSTAFGAAQPPQGGTGDRMLAPDVVYSPEPRQWLLLAATLFLALIVTAALVGVGVSVSRRRQRQPSLDRLAQRASDAVEAIDAGADLRDTVTRCYLGMMHVLKEERGLQ